MDKGLHCPECKTGVFPALHSGGLGLEDCLSIVHLDKQIKTTSFKIFHNSFFAVILSFNTVPFQLTKHCHINQETRKCVLKNV